MNPEKPTCESSEDPLARARAMRLRLRTDLHVSRQIYQHEPVYVVHDPVSFRSHRLSLEQYRVLARLDAEQTAGENYRRLSCCEAGLPFAEETFCQLLMSFAQLGLIVIPGTSGTVLFERHQQTRVLKQRSRLLGLLFLQIPLVNPDRFLSRTIPLVSWLFTRTFLMLWLAGMVTAGVIISGRLSELIQPVNGLLAARNLPFLWAAFVVLKIWHELGHGYACRRFGGSVPEMGTILIAGTPAAYVDATAAWSFPQRTQRLIVMCGGMYFESLIFILSVFVWAFASSPMLQSCAYQLILMTSVVTILFNANPLMKFDGYFILSELIGIQNLRPAADAQVKRLLASSVVGVDRGSSDDSLSRQTVLVTYGVAATVYRFTLIISIAMLVALKFPLVGLLLGAFHIMTTLGMGAGKLAYYLLAAQETGPVRRRACLVAVLIFAGLPLAAGLVPMPFGVVTSGVVGADAEHFVNVTSPGVLHETTGTAGETVKAGTQIICLANESTQEQLTIAEASLRDAIVRRQVARELDPGQAVSQQAAVTELRRQVAEYARKVQELTISAPADGRLVRMIPETDRGRFLPQGYPLAVVVDGGPLLRTWVNEEQLGSLQTAPGTAVSFRVPGRSSSTFTARIVSVLPAAELVLDATALTHPAGGSILVDPVTGTPLEPVFQIDIQPVTGAVQLTEHGARVSLNLARRSESLAAWAARKCVRFVHRLLTA